MKELNRAEARQFSYGSNDDQHNYAFWTVGDTSKTPLLCIPGFTGIHSDFLELGRDLRDSFFVIIPDLPGWGASPKLRGEQSLKRYAEFLLALLDHLNLKKVEVFGHCMGAAIAIDLSLMAPHQVHKLVLVSAPYEEGSISNDLLVSMTDWEKRFPSLYPIFYFWRHKAVAFFMGLFIIKYKSFRKVWRVSVERSSQNPKMDLDVVKENWRSMVHYNYGKIKRLSHPILLIYGTMDLLVDKKHAEALYRMAPNAKIHFMPTAGHNPPTETPGTLATLVSEYFLS